MRFEEILLGLSIGVCFCLSSASSQLLLAQSRGGRQSPDYEIVEYQWENLWDPGSPDLQEWQILSRQINRIVSTPFGDLILVDTDNYRLIRFTPQGEFIEIIGREGSGPGEFRQPIQIGFFPGSDTLWVMDQMLNRMQQFKVIQNQTQYLDSTQLMGYRPSLHMDMKDNRCFVRFLPFNGRRIYEITLTGDVVRSFGEIIEPPYEVFSENEYNNGFIYIGQNEEVLFIGANMPLYERWSSQGELLVSMQFPYPEIDPRPSPDLPRGSVPVVSQAAAYCASNDKLYHWTYGPQIYEVSPQTFRLERCFTFQGFDGFPSEALGIVLIDNEPQFYVYDVKTGGIVVIKKSQ